MQPQLLVGLDLQDCGWARGRNAAEIPMVPGLLEAVIGVLLETVSRLFASPRHVGPAAGQPAVQVIEGYWAGRPTLPDWDRNC
jgi:hypothetical protein